jgi:hypothetical protein
MTIKEAKELNNGLYWIYWHDGSSSQAAVGRLHDGTPWFAPTNWIANHAGGIACIKWRMVKFTRPVALVK